LKVFAEKHIMLYNYYFIFTNEFMFVYFFILFYVFYIFKINYYYVHIFNTILSLKDQMAKISY